MNQLLTVDFYKVSLSDTSCSFLDILNRVQALPNNEERTLPGNGYPLRLHEAAFSNDYVEGEMIRIRMDKVPLKASVHGDTEVINLEEDEGIGEETAFLYNIPLRILALQRNRFGASGYAFAWYFKSMGRYDGFINLDPVLRGDAFNRLAQMSVIKKFNVRFAGIENSDIFRQSNLGVSGVIDLLEQFHAPNMAVHLSMGRRRGGLDFTNVVDAIRGALRVSSGNAKAVKKIEVEAQEPYTGEKEIFDFLGYRMIEKLNVTLDHHRRLPYNDRRRALVDAWHRRQDELRRMFTPAGS